MATTTPEKFTGRATLNKRKLDIIEDWYKSALGDSDKADEIENACFYEGEVAAFESVLKLLRNMEPYDNLDKKEN